MGFLSCKRRVKMKMTKFVLEERECIAKSEKEKKNGERAGLLDDVSNFNFSLIFLSKIFLIPP